MTPRETYNEARGFMFRAVCCDDMIPADMNARDLFERARFTRRIWGKSRLVQNEYNLPAAFGASPAARDHQLRVLAYDSRRAAFCACRGCCRARRENEGAALMMREAIEAIRKVPTCSKMRSANADCASNLAGMLGGRVARNRIDLTGRTFRIERDVMRGEWILIATLRARTDDRDLAHDHEMVLDPEGRNQLLNMLAGQEWP